MVEGNNITTESAGLSYDAVLIISFGGPEGMDDVMPFLESVLRGRNVPRERLLEVAKHYELFDGVSPINEQNRKLISALKQELENNGPRLPIYFAISNWHPLLPDTMRLADARRRSEACAWLCDFGLQFLQRVAGSIWKTLKARARSVGPDAPHVDEAAGFSTIFVHPGERRADSDCNSAQFSEP